jgi:fructoselysine 6-kinase
MNIKQFLLRLTSLYAFSPPSVARARGSIAYKNEIEYSCEVVKVGKVVDTTGCGDSYQGAFIVDYLVNSDILSAMKAASQAAAVTLSYIGSF